MSRKLIIALDNCDRGYEVIASILNDWGSLLSGIKKVVKERELETVVFHIPEELRGKVDTSVLEQENIDLVYGIVDVRSEEESDLVLHPEAVIGSTERRLVIPAAGGEIVRKVSAAATLAEAVQQIYGEAADGHRAYRAGTRCLKPSELAEVRVKDLAGACLQPIEADECMVETAKEQAEYLYANTCGKCTFCRETAYQIRTVLREIVSGKGQSEDLSYLAELAEEAAEETMCSFGQRGFEFIADCVQKFAKDYKEHIQYQNCPQRVCKSFTDIAIQGDKCTGCGKCAAICPEKAVFGAEGYIHFIDTYDCSQCGKCLPECPEQAIRTVRRGRKLGPMQMIPAGRYRTVRRDYKKEGTRC